MEKWILRIFYISELFTPNFPGMFEKWNGMVECNGMIF